MLKNRISKLLITIVLVIACAFTAVACKKKNDGDGGVTAPVKHVYEDAIHIRTAPDSTSDYLVQNGETDYTLVMSKNLSTHLNVAKKEFVELFERATGAKIGLTTDEEVSEHTATGKYISIGNNELFQSANIPDYDATQLTQEGYRIYTKDKSIYIIGGKDIGSVYGVYGFFEIYFNLEQYTRNCVNLDTVPTDTPIPLKLFDVKEVPDIKNHANSMGFIGGDNMIGADVYSGATELDVANRDYRWRTMSSPNGICLPVHATYTTAWREYREQEGITYQTLMNYFKNNPDASLAEYENWIPKVERSGKRGFIHNTEELMPQEEVAIWNTTSAGWYSDNGPQFCYTAHGNDESLELFTDACALKIIASLYHYTPTVMSGHDAMPDAIGVYITVEDLAGTCSCDGCKAAYTRDANSYAGAIVRFCNLVSRKINAWMDMEVDGVKINAPYSREDFQVVFFAYSSYTDAPCIYDEASKTWVPANDLVQMDPQVTVYCVPGISSNQYLYTQESKANETGKKRFEAWNAVSERMWYWAYSVDFGAVSYPYNRLSAFNNEFFQMLATGNVNYYFDNGVSQGTATTGFYSMYWYISCKLCWDSTLDMQTLMDNWFNAVFLDAAPIMRAYYDATMAHDAYIIKNYSESTNIGTTSVKNRRTTECYPITVVRDWLAMFDEAYKVIEKYKTTNNNLYLTLKERIDGELFSPLVVMLDIYCDVEASYLESSERMAYINLYKEIAAQEGGHDYKLDDQRPSSKEYAKLLK
ncbi:MAG: DUF4838 domain-containing protein [Clostridia bacterium]|nr:DUF4838 domain-containing protein [Clostridia bacterium]